MCDDSVLVIDKLLHLLKGGSHKVLV